MEYGKLNIRVVSDNSGFPIPDATVRVTSENEPENTIEEALTNDEGQLNGIELEAPPVDYSMEPSANKPYAEYTITISAPGFESVKINGAEIFSGETALQDASLLPLATGETDSAELFVIPDHTLWGDYPPKIPESEIKTVEETGEIVLSRVVIPEYVVVHNGPPSDSGAQDYYVKYKDYIKNVASSEIYSTWPLSTIQANILAIQSFTLNRVYTEWYRSKGYNFTITSSTAYDQKWMYGRNIYENVDRVVDSIFANYLSRPGVRQPILTSYCDGRRVTCDGLSQWGSQYLANEGYRPIEIIRYYYGNDMYINTAQSISGVPASFPGYDLTIGSSGEKVRQMQSQLNRIAQNYPAIPMIAADGIYGSATAEAVRTFQRIFDLPQTGVVDYPTWYSISNIYVGVSRIAEPG